MKKQKLWCCLGCNRLNDWDNICCGYCGHRMRSPKEEETMTHEERRFRALVRDAQMRVEHAQSELAAAKERLKNFEMKANEPAR